ncbi:MAG: class I SAM-dependent methyltransferase [Armatimonadota bacterium]|nr:class I SAM-dependent methyltransferase [Armatimonadota bacterium]
MPPRASQSTEKAFWEHTGDRFPSLKGAPSTDYYFDCERTLFQDYFPALQDLLLLKTDLWDEAKNTEILRWAAEQGARPVGIDIADSIVRQARAILRRHEACLVADVRALPFRANAFDLVYSMGTIEHFPEYRTAVGEIYRVLKPGGRAIIGVPNKLDPFLRPLLVSLLQVLGRYPYGSERAFTPAALRRLLTDAGFRVTALSGILFMPGWLRIADLWCHLRVARLARLTGWLVRPFAWAYRRFPALRRHGYLLACVVVKPDGAVPGLPPGKTS